MAFIIASNGLVAEEKLVAAVWFAHLPELLLVVPWVWLAVWIWRTPLLTVWKVAEICVAAWEQ